ncbi:hypothetical protein AAU57_14725 [Nonlabens sp. YIK11]|uniref:hypothetical protein n=1 Tax=Nonlabens sp. YIK11 TaxID=1453349 RepID=UPI0006DD1F13|nr:hypothetical protein [Nonlabens sp. YIK11]KQC31863.1 hypothetical protein AAU57_14725 [Nonlabens sp. YIK11]
MVENKKEAINKYTPEQLKGWEEYRNALLIAKTKSDDYFEKAITFISSGSLGLTLTFHDKIVPLEKAVVVPLLAFGWFFLAVTLFLNLISHYKASRSTELSVSEVDMIMEIKFSYSSFVDNLKKRNWLINLLNKISIGSLGSGLISIIIYVSINIYHG